MAKAEENYIFGRNPVKEAILAGREINKAWILDRQEGRSRDKRLQELERLIKERGLILNYTSRSALDKLADGGVHQGIVIQVAAQDYVDSRELLVSLEKENKPGFILILDEIQDGHNLGACLRVADACAIDLVVIPERRSASLDQFVAKASAGAIEHVPVAREVNLSRFVLDLKECGYWIFGAAGEADQAHFDADFSGKTAIIIGNEGRGIAQKLREHCDILVKIPMYGKLNSLNASVACGIICSEAARQRNSK